MPTAISRNLHLCFSRIRFPSFSYSSSSSSSLSSSAPLDKTQNLDSVPSSPYSSSSSATSFTNFNSLYDHTAVTSLDPETPAGSATSNSTKLPVTTATSTATGAAATDDSDGPAATATPPFSPAACIADLSSAMASRRLLPPSSPGRSNAIADPAAIAVGAGVAVPTYSTDPYGDFRRSMEQMATEMGLLDQCSRRERLPELLLCYLVLNRKHTHKYIFGAFADLLVAPMEAAAGVEEMSDVEEEEERGGL